MSELSELELADAIRGLSKAQGKDGKDGRSVLSGRGQPTAALGQPGDVYIEVGSGDVWNRGEGPDPWVSDGSVRGPAGTSGKDGAKGSRGLRGLQGVRGRDGVNGADGPRGLDGVGPDEKVKLDAKDPAAGFLEEKLKPGLNVKFRRSKDGKALVIDAQGGSSIAVENRGGGGGGVGPQGPAGPAGPAGADGTGIPAGGTTSQVLTKQSNADGDADWETPGTGAGVVDSVNGQTGVVVLEAAEVPFTPAGTISATNVQAAIEEVAAEASGLPSGGTVGQVVTNTGPGAGDWEDPAGITPAVDPGDIADPTLATPESNALKINTFFANMRTAGLLA